jgi:hypothetical protein
MTGNFFGDNSDLQYHLEQIDLQEVVGILEDGYAYHERFAGAPRSYADAKDNYRLILSALGEICADQIAPLAAEADEEGARFHQGRVNYARSTERGLELLRQSELMGAVLPWEYGGLNLPQTILQMIIELVSRADAGLMTIFGLQEISATIAEYGDQEMRSRLLPRFARGEVTGAMALTEPDAGSDLGVVQTRATYNQETGTWRLNGVKRFITNGSADVLLVLARSEEGSSDARGLSLFEVEADETVRLRRIENKLGIHASPTCEMQFCDTPARLVGSRRYGLIRYAMAMMNGARIAVSAQALGIAEAAYRQAAQYARKRIQFGRPIEAIPAVSRMLLTMRSQIEAIRALIYEAGRWVDIKKAYDRLASRQALTSEERERLKQADRLAAVLTPLAKYYSTETANRVCYQAMQVHGGTGYMHEFGVERLFRDVRVTNIYEGTSQLQVVAAIGGLLGHALDGLLKEWAGMEYGPELADLKSGMDAASEMLNQCIDQMKQHPVRQVIDYYANDLVDMAVEVVCGWLMLRHARTAERKRAVAHLYISEMLTRVQARAALLQALDPAPLESRESILAGTA